MAALRLWSLGELPLGAFDALAGVVEVDRVLLDADEAPAALDGGDAGGAAAHERVKNRLSPDVLAEVGDLAQGMAVGGVSDEFADRDVCLAVLLRGVYPQRVLPLTGDEKSF